MQVPTVATHTAKVGGFGIVGDKPALRRTLKRARRALRPEERAEASRRVVTHLTDSGLLRSARVVALYAPLPDEVDPTELERHLEDRAIVYPRTVTAAGSGSTLVFHVGQFAQLAGQGPASIREPLPTARARDPDFVVVPGLGFTPTGDRIGYGGGFYDRALARLRQNNPETMAVGLAFSVQIVSSINTEPHDQPLDAIVTERGLVVAPRPR